MLGFMDYVQNAFYNASHWNHDNSYSALTATARAVLDFETPRGFRLNVSSLPSPNFATSYTIGSVGIVDGSFSCLYSSLPLALASRSTDISLHSVIPGYRHLREIRIPDQPWWWEIWHGGRRVDRREALLYGRFFLPASILEALYVRRISPTHQLRLSCVSDSTLPNGGTVLGLLQTDYGKHSLEYLYSTDSGLLGVRGLYNLGEHPRTTPSTNAAPSAGVSSPLSISTAEEATWEAEVAHGRFSAGAELYYGILNKSGGMSTGLRFTTLPTHTGFPYTMTLTLNPLMGNLSSTYAVKAGSGLALASRFDFNFYSYESDIQLGMELWRSRKVSPELEWAVRKIRPEWRDVGRERGDEDVSGVVKARVDQNLKVGVLWEGRIKELLITLGLGVDLKRREQIFRAVGIEVQYSS